MAARATVFVDRPTGVYRTILDSNRKFGAVLLLTFRTTHDRYSEERNGEYCDLCFQHVSIHTPTPWGGYTGCYLTLQICKWWNVEHSNNHEHDELKSSTRDTAIRRLNYIEGHLNGVKKMVEEDRYCIDILRQTYAVRRALQKLESLLIDGHLRTCVVDGVRQGQDEQVLSELVELYEIADR